MFDCLAYFNCPAKLSLSYPHLVVGMKPKRQEITILCKNIGQSQSNGVLGRNWRSITERRQTFSMKNPWTTLSVQKVYDNPWIRVTHRDVLTPAGTKGIYGQVHFKNLAVGIIPLDENYNTWLVGQYRYTLEAYSWEIPEGGCLIGKESGLETAKRELLEETGIQAKRWTHLLDIHTSNSVSDEVGVIYVAQDLSFGEAMPEETEELTIKKLPLEELFEMVMRNEITDSLSVAGILKVHCLRTQGLLQR